QGSHLIPGFSEGERQSPEQRPLMRRMGLALRGRAWPTIVAAGRLELLGLWVAVEVRRLVEILVIPVKDRGRRPCGSRHDPVPVRRAGSALPLFPRHVV